MAYGISVWSLTTQKNIDMVSILQKKCIRIMNSVSYIDHTNPLFIDNRLLKFNDIILMNQLLLAYQYNNNILPDDLQYLFLHASSVHDHNTRVSNTNFFVPSISSTNYGTFSLKHMVPYSWNEFSKLYLDIAGKSLKCSRKIISEYCFDKYINEENA